VPHISAEEQQKGEAFISLFMRLRAKGIEEPYLFSALEKTPRSYFIDAKYKNLALENCIIPLPCGEYIERLDEQVSIIEALKLDSKNRVLEIGAGSGFTAALMARIALRVTSLERYKTLSEQARQNCAKLKLNNIFIRHADALQETRTDGPFDRIILWPAIAEQPQKFIDLLAGSGILIAPIGAGDGEQTITRYTKTGSRFGVEQLFKVRYSPLIEGKAVIL